MKDLIKKILKEEIISNGTLRVLSETTMLLLEQEEKNWGCDLFDNNSEQKDWCRCSMARITNRPYSDIIKNEINNISNFMKGQKDLSERIKFYSEEDSFFSNNISNLNELQKLLSYNCKKKTEETIQNFKKDLAKKFLFVDKEEDKITYSLLNKLNTNYSALSYILTNFRDRAQMKDKSFDDIFNTYFKPITKYRNDVEETSESKFSNLLINFFSKKTESNEIIDNVLKTIRGTDDIGKKTEMEAHKFLVENYGQDNVKDFSGDYSWVDFLGVDIVVNSKKSGGWIPVQIKTSIEKCVPNKKFCKNVCIGKYRGKWEVREYK